MSPTYDFLVVTILVKDPRPDFNSGPGNYSNISCILALQRSFESNLNNSPSPSHHNFVSEYKSVQASYLWFPGGCRPGFNNGPEDDSKSGPVLAPAFI